MNLFVDDQRELEVKDWQVVRTITEAIRFIDEQCPEVVSLDHDIAGRKDDDFTAVARFITALPEAFRPKLVVIHTGSPVGAQRLHDILSGKVEIEMHSFDTERLYRQLSGEETAA